MGRERKGKKMGEGKRTEDRRIALAARQAVGIGPRQSLEPNKRTDLAVARRRVAIWLVSTQGDLGVIATSRAIGMTHGAVSTALGLMRGRIYIKGADSEGNRVACNVVDRFDQARRGDPITLRGDGLEDDVVRTYHHLLKEPKRWGRSGTAKKTNQEAA